VFVVGSPRSGTTLLYHMLLSAGGFASYHTEADVFNMLVPRFGDLSVRRHREALLAEWLPSEFFRRSGLDPEPFRTKVLERCESGGDFLRLLMESIAERQQVDRWAECTPENLLYVHDIKRTIPDAIFVHIVRDGRDVALSIARQGWIGRRSRTDEGRVLRSGLYWEWMVRRGRESLRHYAGDVLEIRYERLITRPDETLAHLGSFIDHDLSYERIKDVAVGTVGKPNTSFPDENGRRAGDPVGRWRSIFSPGALAKFERATGPLLVELGYPLESQAQARDTARSVVATRALAHRYFDSRYWLKTRTPLGRAFTDTRILRDFRAWDRDRIPLRERRWPPASFTSR
jgi:hypothetical protein